jgi:hypothetical protein
MTERPHAHAPFSGPGMHFQISKLLVAALVLATAATGALIVTVLSDMPPSLAPGGPNGQPPPPPSLQPLVIFTVVTGFFILSWLAVLVVVSRDQILLRLRQRPTEDTAPPVSHDEVSRLLTDLRAELAADRALELRMLGDRFSEATAEYGERRETDGYLNGMRASSMDDPPESNIRSIRRTPPQR